jgi:hypothetical protein
MNKYDALLQEYGLEKSARVKDPRTETSVDIIQYVKVAIINDSPSRHRRFFLIPETWSVIWQIETP